MKMKRVVIDVNSAIPQYSRGWTSGIGRTTNELIEALNKCENLPFEIMLYSQNTKGISAKMMETHFQTRHFPLPHKSWMNRLIGMTHLREISTGYDLLHIPHNFEWVRKPDKTIVTIHDAMFFACPDEVFDHEYARKVYPTLARRCRGIITCSESSKHDIIKYMDVNEEKIFVCPWGYREKLFHPIKRQKRSHPFFLSVSCSTGRKNTMSVIRAYERFVKKSGEHELVLVWSNTPKEVLSYCNKDNLRNHIYILKDVDDEQLSLLYNEATATFFPSRYEGFGLPVLESMACGTPIVTCRNSALPEVGGDAAFYVEPDDEDAMCEYMEQFEQGTLKKEAISDACIAQASKFSWKNCAEKTINAYEACLGI